MENIVRRVEGTSRIVVPVTSSKPNSTPRNSSGAAIHAVSPSDSGPPIAKPKKPAACWRATGSCGDPDHRCHRPSAGSTIIAAPRISRGRDSGCGSVRISTTPNAPSAMGTSTTAAPISTRRNVSIHSPTGRPRRTTSWRRRRRPGPAVPARRRRGGVRVRVRGPCQPSGRSTGPLATISQPARTPRPTACPRPRRAEGMPAGLAPRAPAAGDARPPRELVFDLLERAPDRAAVLLAMYASLVAYAPESPSATRVTEWCQLPTAYEPKRRN